MSSDSIMIVLHILAKKAHLVCRFSWDLTRNIIIFGIGAYFGVTL